MGHHIFGLHLPKSLDMGCDIGILQMNEHFQREDFHRVQLAEEVECIKVY